ncbi:MAG: hypothetical protein QJT81_13925 [Candidatus Thiothrix putei]|uniref:Uncharacterized protein n=1 Tax=Candidatus Thiothrix putei TaxID=3080811 RepID=A0AA95HBB5_9GAMM|nr:MAG: hypothetical protein QJT81_13925 [Candidatus Thiothrix putei]
MQLTPFEEEVLSSILWQLEGYRLGKVTERVTKRILRATLRRIKPKLVARSASVVPSVAVEVGHAVPVNVIVQKIMDSNIMDERELMDVVGLLLVAVELTKDEHKVILKHHKLQSDMPAGWDGICPFARYKTAGIEVKML